MKLDPPFSDVDLFRYIDGVAAVDLQKAIDANPDALQRVEQLRAEHKVLQRRLFRSTCPDTLALGEYMLKALSNADAAVVARHVEFCPHCTAELVQLEGFMATEPVLAGVDGTSMQMKVRRLLATLVSGGSNSGLGLPVAGIALAGVRGSEQGPLQFEAEHIQLNIEVQEDTQPGLHVVLGLVLGTDSAGWQATLFQDDQPVSTVLVDEIGNFMVPSVRPGTYALIVAGGAVEVRINELSVG